MTQIEHLGKELARHIQLLAGLKEERAIAMQDFSLREKSLQKEINRLALDVRSGQASLYERVEEAVSRFEQQG